MKLLILNDKRLGHLNQCIAYARYQNAEYVVVDVVYKYRFFKGLSYLLDRLGIYTKMIFTCSVPTAEYGGVVAAGSTTAYPLKVIAQSLGIKSVSMMLPRGYSYDADIIFAQKHDNPPKAPNIVEIPANFSFVTPKGFFHANNKPTIGIVIGGDNRVFKFSKEILAKQFDEIFATYKGYRFAITTSPRTSGEIENLIQTYPFDYTIIYSTHPINPIPDFLDQCERVFITQDSTSMISEAVSYGNAYIEVLPLEGKKENKFSRLVESLQEQGYLHFYDGKCGNANKKIDFYTLAREGI